MRFSAIDIFVLLWFVSRQCVSVTSCTFCTTKGVALGLPFVVAVFTVVHTLELLATVG